MKISGFAIDMDGTIYKGEEVIPGAQRFIADLKKREIPFVFLTNNSSYGRSHYYNKLKKMGFDVILDNILTSTVATVRYLKEHYPGKTVYPVGTEQFVQELSRSGTVVDDRDPDIVLLAFDTSITYDKINTAYRFLMGRSEFIATHPDDLCPSEDGYDIDIGPFIRFFEQMTGKKAIIVGKPSNLMLVMAAHEMDIPVKGLAMVGDRLYTDIKMAVDNDAWSVLVLTGETQREDLVTSEIKPSFVVNSVDDIFEQIIDKVR